ncbi:MAG: methyltransferase domain-containing protein [Clostridia bacterium]|nr:methyltransferase domain-containing protein [Clostridia bacterium]
MSDDFRSARHWAKELIENAMFPGAKAIDATMGNGHDTKWLCELAGESGHVYAFDIQLQAVESTGSRLESAGFSSRATLIHAGHERMAEFVHEKVDAIVFNLGWRPSGDKSITTLTPTTLAAVDAATKLLGPGGLMTVCIYPGHAEGAKEREALLSWASSLPHTVFDVMLRQYLNQPGDPPLMIAIRRRP